MSDNPLVFTDTGEALSGGNFHAEPVAFAADMLAMAVCEIGSISERRVAMLTDPALSGLPAFLTPRPGLNSGFMLPQVTAAATLAEIPTTTPASDALSKALKKRGFKFVGSTICYSFLQACGLVNDHVTGCFRHREVAGLSSPA